MTRSAKGLGNAVYKVEYWYTTSPDRVSAEGPYSTKGAAKGRLTTMKNYSYGSVVEGRVLELTGEWVALTDLNSGVVISAVVGPETYEYVIEPGSWAVSPEVREHFGDELLDKINKRGAPRLPPGTPNTHIQKPTVGRIVHYTHAALVGDNGEGFPEIDLVTHAAMILSVGEGYNAFLYIHPAMTRLKELGSVDEYSHNMVEPPLSRAHIDKGTPFSPTPKPGHWSWPPRA